LTSVDLYLPAFAGGGAERVFVRLANHYSATDLRTRLVVNVNVGPLKDLVSDQVELIDLKATRTRDAIPKLARYMAREKPEAMISALTFNNLSAIIARTLSRSDTRLVVSERNHLSSDMARWSPVRRAVVKRLVRTGYRRVDAITAVTAGVAEDLAEVVGIPAGSIHVIQNPTPAIEEIEAARLAPAPHPWLEDGRPVVVAIGRLETQKDYPLLLDALAEARRTIGDLHLIVLGEGSLLAELEAKASANGLSSVVSFQGFVMNRLDYLVRASLFVLSSVREGFPNALVEAVACGVPVVSTDSAGGGAREILADGMNEALVPVGDVEMLAAAMVAQLQSPPEAGRLAAIAGRYSLERTAERFRSLI